MNSIATGEGIVNNEKERWCARNGSGKTALMKALTGEVVPDQGEIRRSGDVTIAMLPQNLPECLPGTVYEGVAAGGQEHRERPPQEKQKLSYKEALELEHLPQKIEALEKGQKLLWETINNPAFYAGNDAAKVKTTNSRLAGDINRTFNAHSSF